MAIKSLDNKEENLALNQLKNTVLFRRNVHLYLHHKHKISKVAASLSDKAGFPNSVLHSANIQTADWCSHIHRQPFSVTTTNQVQHKMSEEAVEVPAVEEAAPAKKAGKTKKEKKAPKGKKMPLL